MRGVNDLPGTTTGASPVAPKTSGRNRLDSIDLLRGLVMVIMALDHVRDFFSSISYIDPLDKLRKITDPVDLTHTSAGLFLTRFVTHYCAPTFVFLAGAGAFLYGSRVKTKGQLSWFLLSRGLWLVFLEITWVRWSWTFNWDYPHGFGTGVIAVIGAAMVVMAGLVYLPTSAVAVLGVALIAFHNFTDGLSAEQLGLPHQVEWLWRLAHRTGKFQLFPAFSVGGLDVPQVHFETGYCLLPWLGVMAAGYGFGALFLLERSVRRRELIGMGLVLTALFVLLRYANVYGDSRSFNPDFGALGRVSLMEQAGITGPMSETFPNERFPEQGTVPGPWAPQGESLFTLFSFLNCQKYPPSLLYLLMTLGPAIVLLGVFDRPAGAVGRFFVTFGRVPLFFYLLHLPLIHGLRVALDYWQYNKSPFVATVPWPPTLEELPPDYGYGLPVVYLVWALVILLLYPVCYWFAGVKERNRGGWLSYL